jgi:hypothetical protein
MTPKHHPADPKSDSKNPPRKLKKGATETTRLFLDVNDANRRSQILPLSRYVE